LYRARKVIALIIGCGIIVASWIIGCEQSEQLKAPETSWYNQILRYVPGTKASSQPKKKATVTTRTGELSREIGEDSDFSKMVLIRSGKFKMGTSNSIAERISRAYEVLFWEDEQPEHIVELDDYYISKYEVSNSQYKKFLDITGYKEPKYWRYPKFRRPEQPVIGVTWTDANRYCNWLSQQTGGNYRLPTEAEWERAAVGPFQNIYPWGNEFDEDNLNYDFQIGKTTGVNSYPLGATSSGIMNLAGNVAEWVGDWYAPNYYAQCHDQGIVKNPIGPTTGTEKVYRGGAWNDWQLKNLGVRGSKRYHTSPDTSLASIGFRYVKDVR